uniref:Sushi domain containing 2 n=1 Tax=Stegastes partitus TaxID=144197 RepID=A0A3B4ZQQ6_9TELE
MVLRFHVHIPLIVLVHRRGVGLVASIDSWLSLHGVIHPLEKDPSYLRVNVLCSVVSVTRQSCQGFCDIDLGACSCEPTCTSLKTCCTDYREYCVNTFPYSGTIFGGTDFVVLDATFNQSSQIICRFDDSIDTLGYVDDTSRGHCISPLLYETGWVSLHISDHGMRFDRVGSWLSVHSGKVDPKFKANLVNSTKWQYYGTPNVGGSLEMTWNTSLVRADRVNIELWGYKETGEPYSDNWQGRWEYLYSLAKHQPNSGSFSFVPKPAGNGFSSWELGSVRVSPSTYPDGTWNVQAAWTEDHALAWHLEEKFRQDSAAWALEKCLAWDLLEEELPNFLNEIIDCPCTLAQARADTGRFHVSVKDPHFITFDGVSYTFNGKGEYTLVTHRLLRIQGRTEPVNETSINATMLTSVAMENIRFNIIEVRLASAHNHLEVLQNHKTLSFAEQSWMNFDDSFVFCPTPTNVTVMFPSGAGVEVRLREGTMTTTVLLPEEFKGSIRGLLGNMNDDPKDDLVHSNGQPVQNYSNPEEVFRIGANCKKSLKLLIMFYDPLAHQAAEICTGEGSQFCRYDILVGRSPQMGNATRVSFQSHVSLVNDLKPVVTCVRLSPPIHGTKEGTGYLRGATVRFSCDDGYTLIGSAERTCQKNVQSQGGMYSHGEAQPLLFYKCWLMYCSNCIVTLCVSKDSLWTSRLKNCTVMLYVCLWTELQNNIYVNSSLCVKV